MIEIIEVSCIVLPTGETLWMEADQEELSKVVDKWASEHPEFIGGFSTMGVVSIFMPKDNYIAIGAHHGSGCFEFPQPRVDK